MNTIKYLSGFAIMNLILATIFVLMGLLFMLMKNNDCYMIMFVVIVPNLVWRFIWGIVGLVIVYKDLKPNNLCLQIVPWLEADVYIFYAILLISGCDILSNS